MDTAPAQGHYLLGVVMIHPGSLYYVEEENQPDDCNGCCMSNSEHHMPALITRNDFSQALHESNILEHEVYHVTKHPKLQLSQPLRLPCLHGQSRLVHALRDSSANWIPVDLYSSGISLSVLV